MSRAVAPFTIDTFERDVSDPADGVASGRCHLTKTFTGDLEGTSRVEMLTVEGPDGRAYVALEQVEGTLVGRRGRFALLHFGMMEGDELTAGRWSVAAGSGTGSLAGLRGEATIEVGPDGAHTLVLEYELPEARS